MVADIILIAVVALFTYRGYKRGLIKALVGAVSFGISFIASLLLYPYAAHLIRGTVVFERIEKVVREVLIKNSNGTVSGTDSGILAKLLLKGTEGVIDGAAAAFSVLLVNALAFVAVLILVKLIMGLLVRVLNVFSRLPVIKQCNRLGGALLGGMLGIGVMYVVFALVILVAPLKENSRIYEQLEESTFSKGMYNDNVVINFISEYRED